MTEAHCAPANLEALTVAVNHFTRLAARLSQYVEPGVVPCLCQKTWTMYDHIFAHHMLPQMTWLNANTKPSPAQLGTTNL